MKKILIENLIIRDAFKNISKNLKEFQKLIVEKNLGLQYKNMYSDYFHTQREFIGKQTWLDNNYPEYERELIDEILDFDLMLKDDLEKIKNLK